jgi:ornithine carbamoyltransferase
VGIREVDLKGKDLLSVADLSREDIRLLISNAIEMKAEGWSSLLSEKTLVLMFEKPSLRTRLSFEIAMRQLGGHSLYLSPDEVGLGKRESVPDVAQVLSRYADAIVARTFSHQTLEVLASYAAVPVINALSDLEHPCQALADLLTIYEKKETLEGITIAYIGDGNNVAHSLLLAASLSGANFRMASSMGQEAEADRRRQVFTAYQVNSELLSLAKEDAILMHPLPAHHGEEVAENILYSPQSVVFDQAENRMHLQKTLLAEILGGLEIPLAD